jgi:hypothetical protein
VCPIIKVSSLGTSKQKTQDGESLSEPLLAILSYGEFWKDQMRTICGSVPHLIVSSDTEQRPYEGDAKNWLVDGMGETLRTSRIGETIWRSRRHMPHSGMLCGGVG